MKLWTKNLLELIFGNVALVLRTYNNNPDTVKAVERAFEAEIGLVVVVVHAHDPQTRGNVTGWLKEHKEKYGSRLQIIQMTSGYSWVAALRTGFEAVEQYNEEARWAYAQEIDFVLATSNETIWKPEHLQAMVDAAQRSEGIGCVGTSFNGRQFGKPVDLGQSYRHPRNTFMLTRLSAYNKVRGFNSFCDNVGGMEDLHFLISLAVDANYTFEHLDLQIDLLVGKNHNQEVKEAREREAMAAIANWWRTRVHGYERLEQRVEYVLEQFGIDNL